MGWIAYNLHLEEEQIFYVVIHKFEIVSQEKRNVSSLCPVHGNCVMARNFKHTF